MACSEQSHSRRSTRSSRVRLKARFFFKPRQLSGQFSNLGVEFNDLLFVILFHSCDAFTIVDEQLGEVLNRIRLPPVEDIGMNAMLRCELGNGLFFLQNFQYDPCFFFGHELPSWTCHTTKKLLFFCLVYM